MTGDDVNVVEIHLITFEEEVIRIEYIESRDWVEDAGTVRTEVLKPSNHGALVTEIKELIVDLVDEHLKRKRLIQQGAADE